MLNLNKTNSSKKDCYYKNGIIWNSSNFPFQLYSEWQNLFYNHKSGHFFYKPYLILPLSHSEVDILVSKKVRLLWTLHDNPICELGI